jgi:transcription elongation factor Elf1
MGWSKCSFCGSDESVEHETLGGINKLVCSNCVRRVRVRVMKMLPTNRIVRSAVCIERLYAHAFDLIREEERIKESKKEFGGFLL